MPITTSSTLDEIRTAYLDNADYVTAGNVAMAQEFARACRLLLLKTPEKTGDRDGEMELNLAQVRKELEQASAWIAENGPAPAPSNAKSRVRYGAFNYGRE